METDISLIEVAGEDDSLLQQIPEDDLLNLERNTEGITAGNSGFFLCSPLLTDRSNGTIAGSSTASSTDYTDKENINANNIEGPKLSIMPQQMKKKKKAGGYNLRKSLAWNKAFFTDEGVLDSVELSMITGSLSTSCGEALGAIDEEIEIPAVSSGGCYNDLSLKDKLFKDTSTSTPSGGRKNGRCLLPKRGSSTKDNVKLKELSAKDVNRSASKRGSCPRPVASSSVKRPTISTTTKTVNKEERISKIPVPKRDPAVLSRAPRNAATVRPNDAKSNQVAQRVNQVAQRAGNNPKMTTLKGSSVNAKRALNKDVNASKSLKAKTTIEQPRRKLANPVLKVDSSRSQHESTDSNEGLKAAKNSLISKPLPSNDDDAKKVSASITQNAPPDGRKILNQIQMPKPSGLRMPSPSMGFFGQKKFSSFQSVLPDTPELHDLSKSNIPNVRIAGPSNPICQLATLVPRNTLKANHGEAYGETNVVSCLSSGSSLEPFSHDRAKSALKVANIVGASTMNKVLSAHGLEKPDVRSLSNPVLEHLGDVARIQDEIHDQLEECQPHHVSFNNFGDPTKSHLDETIDLCSQGIRKALDNQLSGAQDCNEQSSEQVEFTNSSNCKNERISPDHDQLEECQPHHVSFNNFGDSTKSHLDETKDLCSQDIQKALNNQLSGAHDCNEQSSEQVELTNSSNCKNERTSPDHERLGIGTCNSLKRSRSSIEFDRGRFEDVSNNSNGQDSCSFDQDEALDPHKMRILRTRKAEASDIDQCISNECNNAMQATTADSMHVDDEKPTAPMLNSKPLQGCSLVSQNDSTSCENEGLTRESNEVLENKLYRENDCSSIPHSKADACVDSSPVDRNCNNHTDEMVDIGSDMHQNNTSSGKERNQNDQGSETLPISQDIRLSDTENQLYEEVHVHIGSEHVQTEDEQNSPVLVNGFNQLPGFSELQNCCINQGNCSIDDLLHRSNSEENNEEIIIDSSDVCPPECLSDCNPMASPKDNSSIHQICETRTDDNILMSLEIEASLRRSSCSTAKSSDFDKISGEVTFETMSREIMSDARTTCNDLSFCSPTKDLGLSIPNKLDNHKSLEMNGNTPSKNKSELNSEMDQLLDTKMCSTHNDNARSEARTTCNDSSFCSSTKDLGSSIPNDDMLSRENREQYMEAKELENQKMNGNTLFQNESELNSEMDHLLDIEMCSIYNDNAQSEARTTCNSSSFCSSTKDLGSSIPNVDILSRKNSEQYMEAKELENQEMNGNTLFQNESEFNSEMDHLLDIKMCSIYNNNARSEARTTCNDPSFCSPTKDLGSSISNDDILSRENSERHMEAKKLKNQEMNGNTLFQNESELNSKLDHLLDIEMCSIYNDNARSEAGTTCNDSSFCSPTKDLGSSIPNDDILSRENSERHMEAKELKNQEMNGNTLFQNESELNNELDHLLDIEMCNIYNDNARSEVGTTCNDSPFCSPTKDLGSSIPNDDILSRENIEQCMEAKELENHKSPEMNGNILFQNENELNGEMDRLLDTETCSAYDGNSLSLELKSEDVGKQNALGIITSTNAVPFSEEWLAALEAAGEEILTIKTGAVQNSPPDKSQPEPGPWSPVKRKNNQGIGPFDCTKCTKAGRTP
ncbi:uncharacterized protein LOC120087775 isoform X2 [Benincasa hispida]|uniref:uncharacterized protein LOC120087775 isoform X2 n=1 Tax=Benincasa hispida TaxID=102211 RepID=UPI0018FF3421|nr:uncharacterized protein LOC120087775 isoform X2 [Benincasa hispida]